MSRVSKRFFKDVSRGSQEMFVNVSIKFKGVSQGSSMGVAMVFECVKKV